MLDADKQKQVLRRLSILRGQIDGLERMISDGKYCVDILTQISAIHEALRGVGKVVVQNHLATCVASDMRRGKGDAHVDELVKIIYKLSK